MNNNIFNSNMVRGYGMTMEEFVNMPSCYQQQLSNNYLKMLITNTNILGNWLDEFINREMKKKEQVKQLIKR